MLLGAYDYLHVIMIQCSILIKENSTLYIIAREASTASPCQFIYNKIICIIESVDSISRDEPDSPFDAIHYKRWNISG